MKIQQIKMLALALCLTASAGLFAQKKQQERSPEGNEVYPVNQVNEVIAKLDTNNDSLLSKSEIKGSEFEQRLLDNWTELDTNNDGLVSQSEITAFQKAQPKR